MNKIEFINNLTKRLLETLTDKKVETDVDILDKYARDETSDLRFMPDLLVRAESVEDVSNTLKICNELKVCVTPRGAGTGVTGGSVPVKGGVVLSIEKMNRILEIDKNNMIAVVEPGVITFDLQQK